MRAKLERVLNSVEEKLGRSVSNLLVVEGIVMKKLPLTKTQKGDHKFKFVLGFEQVKSMFVCTRGDMALRLSEDLNENDVVRVIGKLHTAHWEENGNIKDTFECHSYSVEVSKPNTEVYN